jgi:hypothetical protein
VIELANYMELAVNTVVPVVGVKQFLHDLVYC